MDQDSKYTVGMQFWYTKEGEDKKKWLLNNEYHDMDYAQMLSVQMVGEEVYKRLNSMGVVLAEAAGFDMAPVIAFFNGALPDKQPQEIENKKTPNVMGNRSKMHS